MSTTKIEGSTLVNSPIITDSHNISTREKTKKKKSFWYNPWTIGITTVILSAILGIIFDNPFQMSKVNIQDSQLQNSPVINESPGAKVNYNLLNFFTDKDSFDEATGIKDPLGIYLNGKKVGTVINPTFNEAKKTFVFEEVRFSQPIPNNDLSYLASEFQFNKYTIKGNHIDSALNTGFSPIIKNMQGSILDDTKQ